MVTPQVYLFLFPPLTQLGIKSTKTPYSHKIINLDILIGDVGNRAGSSFNTVGPVFVEHHVYTWMEPERPNHDQKKYLNVF